MTKFIEHHFCSDCRETFRTGKQLRMHSSQKHKAIASTSISGE